MAIKLVLYTENGEEKVFEVPVNTLYVFDSVNDFELKNTDISHLTLQKLHDEINNIDLSKFKYLKIKIGEKAEIDSGRTIGNVVHRIIGYSRGGERYEDQEVLSFKFRNNTKVKFLKNGTPLLCDETCPNLQNGYCTFYNASLDSFENDFIICRLCFLKESMTIAPDILSQEYYKVIGEGRKH